jgi:hypothetical protein
MGLSSWLTLLIGAMLLVGCGSSDHYDAVDGAAADRLPSPSPRISDVEATSAAAPNEGTLNVRARSALQRRLGAVHFVVRDAAGDVIAGGDQEADGGHLEALELSMALPAGEGLRLQLTATTTGVETSTCTASVGPFRIEAGSEASFDVFVWRCDGAPGADAPEPECYWLADWVGVTSTSAAIGELIGVSAAGHDAAGDPARIVWSARAPEQGRFIDATAGETAFRCAAPNAAVALSVALSDGSCQSQLTKLVACREAPGVRRSAPQ